jgi:hypothetical protein
MENTVKAEPTKEFFIQMLTKDIKLERAIIDLIDNSIDGAKKKRVNEDFNGLWIKINIEKDSFSIKDNCGGFSLEIAKNYAFMFGRPEGNANEIKHSVGRFGVGMKRALFKIGSRFEVESKCESDHFQIEVDVEKWRTESKDWSFGFNMIDKNTDDLGNEDGVFIKVQNLNNDVLEEFASEIFVSQLKEDIERTLSFFIDKNLQITLNNKVLSKSALAFLENENLKPAFFNLDVKNVNIKIYTGVGKPNMDLAGWYVYCNDRLVLERDKTNLTGWQGRSFGESNVQKFHNIYSMFRGVVFFSADDSKLLPMTTTKTGIDSNSNIYKAAKSEMINAMKQVIAFLKSFDSDIQREEVIAISTEVEVTALKTKIYSNRFIYPTIQKIGDSEKYSSISFKALKLDISKAKNYFNVTTNSEVGLSSFEYFLKSESENL